MQAITQAIRNLIDIALDGEVHFDEFSDAIQKLGVETITLDMLRGHHTFYMADRTAFDHPLKNNPEYPVAENFNNESVVTAIARFDKREITATQFHAALAAAGVSHARCYFLGKRAIYLSPKGEFYIEQWS